MIFGDKLKALRIEKGLSQKALASALNLSERTIQNYEAGKALPKSRETLNRISSLFGISVSQIVSYEDRDNIESLISDMEVLFAGGKINESDLEKIALVINKLRKDE